MGLSRTFSEINVDFGRKSQIFPAPGILRPNDGVPSKICNVDSAKKLVVPLPDCGKSLAIRAFHLGTVPQCDGQTDRLATTISLSVHIVWLTRDKNVRIKKI